MYLSRFTVLVACTVAALSWTRDAVAQDAPSAPGDVRDDTCDTAPRALAGADAETGAPEVDFVEGWRPQLQALATCLSRPEHARSCIRVQGRYDERVFDDAVTRALGSQRAAQLHRAEARGNAVLAELFQLGVRAEAIREEPPPLQPSYRGVELQLVIDCLPAAATPAASAPEWSRSPESVASELERRGLLRSDAPAPAAPPQEPAPSPWRGVFVGASLPLGVLVVEPDSTFFGTLRLSGGYAGERLVGRLFLGLSTGTRDAQAFAFEWGLGLAYRLRPWLALGAVASHRLASSGAFDPWLEQSWALGAEGSLRLWQLDRFALWLEPAVSPIGARTQRAVVVDDRVFQVEDRTDYALRFDLALSLRGHFF